MGALADCCFPCCKCVSFFGILFYVAMGFIILGQVQFLKFIPHDKTSSVVACFITALIEGIIFVGLIVWQRVANSSSVQRQNYITFESQRRPRQSTFKGIAMGDLKIMKQGDQNQRQRHLEPSIKMI